MDKYYLEIGLLLILSWWIFIGLLYWGKSENKKLAQILLLGLFYPLLKNETNKALSTREIIGLVSISIAVLILGVLAITGVIDGSY